MLMKKFFSAILVSAMLVSAVPCFAQEIDEPVVPEEPGIVLPYKVATASFSFASDSFHNGPTFTGTARTNTFYSDAMVDLMVDVNNDINGGIVTFLSNLNLKAEAREHKVFEYGGQYLHVWKVSSDMQFTHVNPRLNTPILGIGFKDAVLTSWSPNLYTLGETMTLQTSLSADPSVYMKAYTLLEGIGVPQNTIDYSRDIAFTFTNVRAANYNENEERLVNLDEEGNFKDDWIAEGSFSASAATEKWWGLYKEVIY